MTSNIYLISNKFYVIAIILSSVSALVWTISVRDLNTTNWKDRIAYIIGSVIGTAISLFLLQKILK